MKRYHPYRHRRDRGQFRRLRMRLRKDAAEINRILDLAGLNPSTWKKGIKDVPLTPPT